MKKNTFKRVLAGSLALLTVAAYMPANVGGLIQVKDSLVANAADPITSNLDFRDAKSYLTSINDGEAYSESQIKKLGGTMTETEGTTVVMKSSVPLTVTAANANVASVADSDVDVVLDDLKTYAPSDTKYLVEDANKTLSLEKEAPTDGRIYVTVDSTNVAYEYNGKWYYTAPASRFTSEDAVADTNKDKLKAAIAEKTDYVATKIKVPSTDGSSTIKVTGTAINNDNTSIDYDANALQYILVPASYGKYSYTAATPTSAEVIKFGNNSADEVKTALLKAKGIETDDATYTAGSKFVKDNDSGLVYLCVKLKAIEPATQPDAAGTYTYTYTAPSIDGVTVKVNTIAEPAVVNFYNKFVKENDTNNEGSHDVASDNDWKDLKINTTEVGNLNINGSSGSIALVQNSTVTITNTVPFEVVVDDHDSSKNPTTVGVTYADGKFTAEFKMPKYAGDIPGDKVTLSLVKKSETYSYGLNSDKTAVIANGTYTKNLEAASMDVKTYEETDTNYFPATDDKGVAVGSNSIDYGDTIAIKTVAGSKFIQVSDATPPTTPTVKITKGTNDVVYDSSKTTNTIGATKKTDADGEVTITSFKATSGTYTVSYEVDTIATSATSGKSQTFVITKTFTVDARGKITADNVALKVTVKKNNKYQPLAGIIADDSIPDGTETSPAITLDEVATIPSGKEKYYEYTVQCATGKDVEIILTQAAKETVTTSGYTFFVEPVVTPKGEEALTKDTDFLVGGTTFSAKNAKRTVDVTITNSEYGGSVNSTPISINWSVVDYDAKPIFAEELKDTSAVSVALEDVATLNETILAAAVQNEAAKALTTKDVTFEYVAGTGANRANNEDELDSYESGLPTEKGDYTVYMSYGDKIVTTADVSITSYKLNFVPDAAALSIGYGKDFTVDSYKLLDSNGKAVKNVNISELKVQFMQPKYEYKSGKYVQTGEFEEYGNTTNATGASQTNKDSYLIEVATSLGYKNATNSSIKLNAPTASVALEDFKTKLNAGTYYVTFTAKISDEEYAFTSDTYELTVSKKALSDDSVNILIDPAVYDGTTKQPNENSIAAKDTDTGFDFLDASDSSNKKAMLKLNEGKSAVKVGSYDLEIGLTDSAVQNYEGVATVKWNVVNKEASEATIKTGMKWDDTMTTLYDNGRIHLEINKNAVSRISLPADTTISEFGVIVDNTGKIPEPSNFGKATNYKYGYDYAGVSGSITGTVIQQDAYYPQQQLKLGNGYIEGQYDAKGTKLTDGTTVNAESTTYKVNIKVKDVETGIWARPYVLLSNGDVVYGAVKYLNLEEEAKQKLNLQMPYVASKDVVRQTNLTDTQKKKAYDYVNAGYDPLQNRAYAYATFTDLDKAGFASSKVLEVSDFGVVVDNKGVIDAPTTGTTVADIPEEQMSNVKEKLVIGGNSKLIVGHYQKGNKNLAGDNEYTANIKTYNSETGVWIRPYLDLGNDLIVYGDPIYVQSVSEYFSDGIDTLKASVVENQTVTDDRKIQLKFAPSEDAVLTAVTNKVTTAYTSAKTGNKAKDAPEVKVVKAGVVLDKKGTLVAEANKTWANVTKEDTPSGTAVKAASTLYPTAKANLILGNGFVEGKKTSGLTKDYIGKVSPAGKDLIVKNYVVYDIGGTEVTVYGAAQAYEYTNKNWDLNKKELKG